MQRTQRVRDRAASRTISAFVAILFGLLVLARQARATDFFWAAPVSGDPTVATNWSPVGVPQTISDSAIYNLGSSGYTVSTPSLIAFDINAIEVDNDTVTFQIPTIDSMANTVIVGNTSGDVGNVTLLLGELAGQNGAVGNAAGSTGTVIVNGSSPSGTFFGTGSIGGSGTGTVNVFSGGAGATYVGNQPGSQGTVTASGAKSTWFDTYLGYGGTGSVTIQNGAAGNSLTKQYIGYAAGSQGTLSVTGTGSTWTNGTSSNDSHELYVGYGGTGEMDFTAGATGRSVGAPVYLGFQSGGNGTMKIDGAGSSYQLGNSNGSLFIGESGTGKFSITGGGKLDTQGQPLIIGDVAGSNGSLTIDGATSSLISTATNNPISSATVGNAGTGSFSVTGGAQVTLGNVGVAVTGGSSGTVTVDGAGSRLSVPNGFLTLGSNGSGATASVTVQNGATLSASQLALGVGGNINNNNNLTFDGAGTTGNFTDGNNGSFNIFQGAVHVQNGAVVNALLGSEKVVIAPNAGNNGALDVDGAGSSFNVIQGAKSLISLGGNFNGTAQLSVTNGGTVNIGVQNGIALGHLSVGPLGTVDIQQGSINVLSVQNSGMLHVDGVLQASGVNSTGNVSGTGQITGGLTFSGTLAPGDSPGTLTAGSLIWNAGGILKIAINDATGTAGGTTGWSLMSVGAGVLLGSLPHTISLESLTAGNQPGLVPDFDPTHNYSWTVLTSGLTLSGAAGFTVDTSSFQNPLIGHFSVMATGDSLIVNYKVPEPSTLVLAGLGVVIAGCARCRRSSGARA
ncbi:MAG TPA: PEP-CTERM sorting domain-containing protein [Pirellulales bacterium]|nr:PEP-CTERM sorting domain-containing protein [Pirellulales bacterium]